MHKFSCTAAVDQFELCCKSVSHFPSDTTELWQTKGLIFCPVSLFIVPTNMLRVMRKPDGLRAPSFGALPWNHHRRNWTGDPSVQVQSLMFILNVRPIHNGPPYDSSNELSACAKPNNKTACHIITKQERSYCWNLVSRFLVQNSNRKRNRNYRMF